MQRANCGRAECDWLRPRPRPTWLDMGIYWRQPHQSAPHLINEPEHCMDQEVYEVSCCICRQLIEIATGIQRTHLYFSVVLMRRRDALLRHSSCNHSDRKVRKVYFSCQLL